MILGHIPCLVKLTVIKIDRNIHIMEQYLKILEEALEKGAKKKGRNGITRSLFIRQMRFDLRDGFPAVTSKKLYFKKTFAELLWFIKGPTRNGRMDLFELEKYSKGASSIWKKNAYSSYWIDRASFDGDLGRIYGAQWRDWRKPNDERIDQLQEAITMIKNDPFNRRIIVSAYNPGEFDQMSLPPCHIDFHFYCDDDEHLSVHMYQRSCDLFLGVPFNIASYALLLSMIAQVTGRVSKDLIITLGDCHIYEAHIDAVREQLSRTPYDLPQLELNPDIKNIDDFKMEDIKLINYEHHPAIKAEMIE